MVANAEKAFQYFKVFSYCLAAIFAGYTISDLDLEFLDRFNTFNYQLAIVLILVAGFFNFTFKEWRKNLIEIVGITIISLGTLQLLRCKFKKKNEKQNDVDQNNLVQ